MCYLELQVAAVSLNSLDNIICLYVPQAYHIKNYLASFKRQVSSKHYETIDKAGHYFMMIAQ